MNNNKFLVLLLCLLFASLGYATLSWLESKQKEKEAIVDKIGVETTGIVIKKSYGKDFNNPMRNYSISFEFLNEKNLCTRFGFKITQGDYERVIVGRKYKVKYLPEDPIISAQIYLSEPIYSEDVNIEKELERILETYK